MTLSVLEEDESKNTSSSPSEQKTDETKEKQQQFLERVKQAEELAQKSPGGYKLQVVLWALFGYLYMFIVPLCLLLVLALVILFATKFSVGFLVGLKPLIAALFVAFGCYIKALWVRFDPPNGNELKRNDYPQLFAFIDNLSKQTGVKVDHVLLTREINASVVQYPKFGLFGFYENYLNLGLSLMMALTEREFQSVVAHELGHLANHHSKRSAWIYSMRTRWNQIMSALDANSSFLLVFMMRFLDWYQPRFLTLTQVIARRQEREADTLAIAIAGADAHARGFLAITARDNLMSDRVLDAIYRSYPLESAPPSDLYNKVAERMAMAISEKAPLIAAIENMLTEEPHPFDTHPSSAERIRSSALVTALDGLSVRQKAEQLIEIFALNEAIEKSAAETIFGADYKKALAIANQEWQNNVAESWAIRTEKMLQLGQRQKELDNKIAEGAELKLEEKIEYANNIELQDGIEKALPYFESILKENAEEPVSTFTIGAHLLLSKIDEAGLPLLEITAKLGKDYRQQACEILLNHYDKRKDTQKVAEYEKLLIAYYEEAYQYQQERDLVSPTDELISHTANPEEVEVLVDSLKQFKEIRSAFLLEKAVKVNKDDRMFLLLLRLQNDPGSFAEDKRHLEAQEICHKVAAVVQAPGSLYVLVISGKNDTFLQTAAKHSNALIYGNA
ncbi:hypothetical protein BH11CYA1_BH11CYA1_04260 [soil metagenome]